MNQYLEETVLLNYSDERIESLFAERKWALLEEKEKIRQIYDFVKDEILFGYNSGDAISAGQVLDDGFGQCNTKGILLMALLRKAGVPCRIHGFTIDKRLQKGAIRGIWYLLSPRSIVHSWVEILFENRWLNLEGFILDKLYLQKIQKRNRGTSSFCGYGAATDNLACPQTEWDGNDTYIQKEGINGDFGVYNAPDFFFKEHGQNIGQLKNFMYKNVVRHTMNRNLQRIRNKW